MTPNRRQTLALALASAGAALPAAGGTAPHAPGSAPCPAPAVPWRSGIERQRRADLGDGRYLNPVLAGDHPDPTILKDGADYYAAFSSFQYYPGVPIWHSRDLVNWTPVATALTTNIGAVWALDIAQHDGRYFIYIPALAADGDARPLRTYVIHAASMRGPWSKPIDMRIDGMIDPGHAVGEDGKRYLFFNGGNRVRLADDGLSADGPIEHVYDGWPIPSDWIIEGFAMEGPKILRKDGFFYQFVAEGGTAGPPTSHMVIVARSRSIHGPWENCPHNPVVRTAHRDEPWWSRGHATAVEGPGGRWWLVYHGYENGFRTLGRQMLLEPIVWDADGWPRATGGDLARPLPMPARTGSIHGQPLSGLGADAVGTKLAFFRPRGDYLRRARVSAGTLTLDAQGSGPADSSPLTFIAGDRSYEIRVEVTLVGDVEAGLLLFYDERMFCGLGLDGKRLQAYRIGQRERWPEGAETAARHVHLRVVNVENVATFYHSADGQAWTKERSFEVAGYNHNVADGFLSLRPAFYAARNGRATFSNFTYSSLA